jgi:hypothetical protein
MWRALFLAIGISLCIFGAECLAVERFELASTSGPPPSEQTPATLFGSPPPPPVLSDTQEWAPPEWAPWSFLSAGAVIVLYSLTINRQG